jgi:hypothetical protein
VPTSVLGGWRQVVLFAWGFGCVGVGLAFHRAGGCSVRRAASCGSTLNNRTKNPQKDACGCCVGFFAPTAVLEDWSNSSKWFSFSSCRQHVKTHFFTCVLR